MVIHHHLTWDACFLRPVNKLCGKRLAAEMSDETQEREARESERGRRRGGTSHPRHSEMEMSVNNRKSEALLSKYGHSVIEAAQPEVKKWGEVAGAGLLWKGGGIEQSVEGLQGLVCHCQPF